jgi:CDP-diacylglycerol--serine O-phosphatidyltransferase
VNRPDAQVLARAGDTRKEAFLRLARPYARRRVARGLDGLWVSGLAEARAALAQRPLIFVANHVAWWDALLLLYFVCCGVSRLARYNVTAESLSGDSGKVRYFEGTPIPTSVVLTGVLAVLHATGRSGDNLWGGAWTLAGWTLHPLSLLFALSGTLMVSKTLRIPKL